MELLFALAGRSWPAAEQGGLYSKNDNFTAELRLLWVFLTHPGNHTVVLTEASRSVKEAFQVRVKQHSDHLIPVLDSLAESLRVDLCLSFVVQSLYGKVQEPLNFRVAARGVVQEVVIEDGEMRNSQTS